MGKILGSYNRKGGVGKSASIINLGAELATQKKKVLLVDGDPQMNITQFFFKNDENLIAPHGSLQPGIKSVTDIISSDEDIENAILTCNFSARRKIGGKFTNLTSKFDVLLGSKELDYTDITLENLSIFKNKIYSIRDNYDMIFIDFSPANSLVTVMFLLAMDYLLVPLHLAKGSSMYGYMDVLRRVEDVKYNYGNPNLDILGLFYTNVQLYKDDQAKVFNEAMKKEVRDSLKLFNTPIRHDYSSTQESESEGLPLCICRGSSEITNDYKLLSREILKRIKKIEGGK